MSMNVIEFTHVGKTYEHETRAALSDVSFSVAQGEFVCFIGASGCGKTTILKLIAGLEDVSDGRITKPSNVSMA